MLVQLENLLKPLYDKYFTEKDKTEVISNRLITFVQKLENIVKNNKGWTPVFYDSLKEVLSLVIDLQTLLPELSNQEAEEIASKVFLHIYNTIIVPLDLPIPDYLEVLAERILEPVLDLIVRTCVRLFFERVLQKP